MKEKNLRGLWVTVFLTVLFGGFAIVMWFIGGIASSPQYVVDRGGLYPNDFGQNVAIKIEIIEEIGNIKNDDKAAMYLVISGNKVLGLIADKDDADIKSALASQEKGLLVSNPVLVAGEKDRSSAAKDNISKIRQSLAAEAQSSLEGSFIVDVKKHKSSSQMLMYGAYGFGALAVFSVGLFAFNVSRRKKAYRELYAQFPELEGNLDLLVSSGQYADSKRGLYVYKDYLIALAQRNTFVPAKDILYLVAIKQTIQQGIASHVNYTVEAYDKNFKKHVLSTLGGSKKTYDDEINAFTYFVDQHYPNILVGADHAPEYQALKNAAGFK